MNPDPVLAHAAAGRFEEAIAAAKADVAATPASARAYERLGSVLALAKRHEEAAQVLAVAIAMDPTSAEALNNFGAVLRAVGKLDEAQRYFERALDVSPAFHEALVNALGWYHKHSRNEEALRRLHAAIDAGDGQAETYEQLGLTLLRMERTELSIEASGKALQLDPNLPDAWANLSNARLQQGDLEGARAAIEEAIRLNPRRAEYYRYYTATTRSKDASRFVETVRELAADPTLSKEDRFEAHFALADIASAESQWETAFHHYVEGNRISRSLQHYDEATSLQRFEEIAKVFSKDVIAGGSAGHHETERPIFIVGMPRSGTTLVEQIIASHPNVYAAGELTYLEDIVQHVFATPGPVTAQTGILYDRAISRIAPPTAMRVTDKMPMNFRYAGLIKMVMPHARIIHTRRDPLDTCWSCFSTLFSEDIAWTCDLGELGRYYRAYSKLMDHWRDALPHGAMLEVQYEELVGDFEEHARRIIAFCGLEWDDRCLSFHETKRAVRTASASQVRKPLNARSIGRSRVYGELLRPLADAIGIDL